MQSGWASTLVSWIIIYYLSRHTQQFNLIMQVPRTDNFYSPSVHAVEYLTMNKEKHLKGGGWIFSLCVL